MSDLLDRLKSSSDVGRPERAAKVCVAGKLVADLKVADDKLFDLRSQLGDAEDMAEKRRDGIAPKLRAGEPSPVVKIQEQFAEAAAAADGIRARMDEHSVEIRVRADDAEWRAWASAHPARDADEDPVGAARDLRWAGGFCNIDQLIPEIGHYVIAYGDDPASSEWWEFVHANAAPGDLTRLASEIIACHEQVVDLGKSRVAWHDIQATSTDSQ